MKKNSFLWAALSMTAALVMTACSNDDNANESPVQQSTVKTIPYSVTVNEGATTRATVDSDNKTLKFADGDKLYVTGTNIKGVLDIQTGTGTASATFSGDLTYSGSGTPASDISLTATLVSAQQTNGSEVTVNSITGAVTVNYPSTAYCADVATAVQKYSNLKGTSTYGAKSFSLTQQTAFLNFVITFKDGTATGTTLSAKVSNNSAAICTANVTTVTDNGVKAKFVLPVAKGTTLSSANVKMGSKAAISFGASQTLDGKVYNVTKTHYTMAANATAGDVGKQICTDGHIHAKNADAACKKGRVAKIVYVGSNNGEATPYNHGLALALTDANNGTTRQWMTSKADAGHTKQDNNTFTEESGLQYNATHNSDTYPAFKYAKANSGTAAPTGCSSWFLASGYQWKQMIEGAGLANLGLQESVSYWSSSEKSKNSAWYFNSSSGVWGYGSKIDANPVRACLAF